MSHPKIRLPFPILIGAVVVFLGIRFAQAEESKPMLRVICATALGEEHKIAIASKTKDGKWKWLSTAELRSGLVSDWLPVQAGELFLAEKKDGKMKEIGHFTYPAGANRALMVSYKGADDAEQLCYDRQAITSPLARKILFLLPDETVGLQVLSLSEFGPFE